MSTSILLVFRIGIANIQPIFSFFQTNFTFILHYFLKLLVRWEIFLKVFYNITNERVFYMKKWSLLEIYFHFFLDEKTKQKNQVYAYKSVKNGCSLNDLDHSHIKCEQ